MLELSVVICAHNPRTDYLRRVLDALRNQSLPTSQWELLLVDNGSKEPLSAAWDLSWHPGARHLREDELGLSFARQRGIREAASDVLVFVDDDNVLSENYLEDVRRINNEWPELGTWGSGHVAPEFEIVPPNNLKDIIGFVGFHEPSFVRWANFVPCKAAMPIGAGLCVRKNVALAYCDQLRKSPIKISGRAGNLLLGAEDYEISYTACSMGFGMGTFPELKLTHLIAKRRISKDYLLRLVEGTQISEYLLAYKWLGKFPRDPLTALGFLDILANSIIRRGLQRRKYFAEKRAARKALEIIKKVSRK